MLWAGAEGYMWAGNAGLQGRGWQIEAPVSECSLGASCWPPRLWLSTPALWTPNRPFQAHGGDAGVCSSSLLAQISWTLGVFILGAASSPEAPGAHRGLPQRK